VTKLLQEAHRSLIRTARRSCGQVVRQKVDATKVGSYYRYNDCCQRGVGRYILPVGAVIVALSSDTHHHRTTQPRTISPANPYPLTRSPRLPLTTHPRTPNNPPTAIHQNTRRPFHSSTNPVILMYMLHSS
ncbi:unnamed protein product, partial [Laminaria digitata]